MFNNHRLLLSFFHGSMVGPSSSCPMASLTLAHLAAPDTEVPQALSIMGLHALVIPGHEGDWIKEVVFPSVPKAY